jgi:glycosyltransferase involved in cell wall biosynthesis
LYRHLTESGLCVEAWYCSDVSIRGGHDKEFGVEVKWDIPLLEGYKYRFFKNYSLRPSVSGAFFGVVNFGMIRAMLREKDAIYVVHGWQFFSYVLVILWGALLGRTIGLRVETPWNQVLPPKGFFKRLKNFVVRAIFFRSAEHFFYIGKQNLEFYLNQGVSQNKLFYTPYAVDNDRFTKSYLEIQKSSFSVRQSMGIARDAKVVLYSGKYIEKKRPLDLIKAFNLLNRSDLYLIMMGEGMLRAEMEQYIKNHRISNVVLTGFVNQAKVAGYYTASDIYVMCSGAGETWGLSINEAMNFELPIIVSDIVGSSEDLVEPNVNGSIYPVGDVSKLAEYLAYWTEDTDRLRKAGRQSGLIVRRFSFQKIEEGLRRAVEGKEPSVIQNNLEIDAP